MLEATCPGLKLSSGAYADEGRHELDANLHARSRQSVPLMRGSLEVVLLLAVGLRGCMPVRAGGVWAGWGVVVGLSMLGTRLQTMVPVAGPPEG